MLTNNVREWEPLWRAFLPVDEIFETVVDSGFVGMRKPEPEIYELTARAARGDRAPRSACSSTTSRSTARPRGRSGIRAVQFRDNARDRGDRVGARDG